MSVQGLDHLAVRTADVAASRAFYVEVLGLMDGERPPFPFPGAWLYAGGRPIVHLIGGRETGAPALTGGFDHIALTCDDIAGMRARLTASGVEFGENAFATVRQIFLADPDGVRIELNFQLEASTGG
jgi:catechol 2,3-dioxygenase-like lactoylglutathione lyase family enzyme